MTGNLLVAAYILEILEIDSFSVAIEYHY